FSRDWSSDVCSSDLRLSEAAASWSGRTLSRRDRRGARQGSAAGRQTGPEQPRVHGLGARRGQAAGRGRRGQSGPRPAPAEHHPRRSARGGREVREGLRVRSHQGRGLTLVLPPFHGEGGGAAFLLPPDFRRAAPPGPCGTTLPVTGREKAWSWF